VKFRAGFDRGSPRRGSGRRSGWVEVEEDTGASIPPKVAPARDIGASRNRRAAAEAIRSPVRGDGGEREEAAGAGLGRFDRPRPEPTGLAQPGGLGGPAGLLSQQASGPEG
jgi:hypothetical protein